MADAPIRILLVEDNEAHAELMRRAFLRAPHRFEVSIAASLAAARGQLAQTGFDVVVADLVLPDGRGTALLPQVPGQESLPVVVLTSHGDEAIAVEAMKAGAVDYVVKSDTVLAEMPQIAQRALRQWEQVLGRRQAEAALARREALLQAMAAAAPLGLLVVEHASERVLFLNRHFCELWHIEAWEEPLRRGDLSWTELKAACQQLAARPAAFLQAFHDAGEEVQPGVIETELALTDGRTLRQFSTQIPDHGDTCGSRLYVVFDITESRRAQELLRQRDAQLAHVARLSTMGEMVAEIAHEINQPLYAIANFARACRNRLSQPGPVDVDALVDWTGKIAKAATRAGEIIRRARHFVRRGEPRRQPKPLGGIIREALELLSFEVRRQQVELHLNLAEPDPLLVIDPLQIEQVVVNLVRNALDSVSVSPRQPPRIDIDMRVVEDWVEVAVRDNGLGLEGVDVDKLFDAFVSGKPQGLGMGLPVSRSIVEAHGGRLWASGNEAGGATFRFTLPLRPHAS